MRRGPCDQCGKRRLQTEATRAVAAGVRGLISAEMLLVPLSPRFHMIDLPVARRLETDRLSYLISELSCYPSVNGEGSLPRNNTDVPLGPLPELRCKVG